MAGRDGWHGPPWARHGPAWHRKRRFLFGRFVIGVGMMLFFILGGMALLAFLLTRGFGGDRQTALLVWIAGCGLALALPALLIAGAIRAFRNMATPLADVMAAADAVADGDLSVRVQERGSSEFARLARSFNRMAEELEGNELRRRNLTADIAHELRTPLHIIQGNLEGILDGVYAPDAEHIEATLEETRALARLVEDLRTISLAEAGQLTLQVEPVQVDDLLSDLATSFAPAAEQAGIALTAEVAGASTDLVVMGDAGRLDQVLTNLVANGLRHTPSGGAIHLHGERIDTAVRITVRDTGEGIPAADLPFVFDRFWRGDRARALSDGAGGGLGLAIARQLVEAHAGSIDVTSRLGQGTCFVIVLPAAQSADR